MPAACTSCTEIHLATSVHKVAVSGKALSSSFSGDLQASRMAPSQLFHPASHVTLAACFLSGNACGSMVRRWQQVVSSRRQQ